MIHSENFKNFKNTIQPFLLVYLACSDSWY